MESPAVSVIVPIYGVEKYVERCARSLFEQSLQDIEYVFVNDCTKDKSINILRTVIDDYPHLKSRIRIINHETNKGLPAARYTGICNSRGKYIAHCDSDDWVDLDLYEKMYNEALNSNSDLVFCDSITTDLQYERKFSRDFRGLEYKKIINKALSTTAINPIWATLARRNLYDNVTVPVANQAEDKTFVIQLLLKNPKISHATGAYYYYFYNPTSISKSNSIESTVNRFYQYKSNQDIILKIFEEKKLVKRFREGLEAYKFSTKMFLYAYYKHSNCQAIMDSVYPELNYNVLWNAQINFKIKVLFILLKFGYVKNPYIE